MAHEHRPEQRSLALSLIERAGTEWALDDESDQASRERLAAIARELCAVLEGAAELELARELAACWSQAPASGVRPASEILKLLEARLANESPAAREHADPARAGRDNETVE